MQTIGFLFLILFAATLFVMYIAIRRSWGSIRNVGGIGAVVCFVSVLLYSLLNKKTSTAHAIFAGIVVGLGFSAVVVAVAAFFQANQASATVKLVSRQPQEITTDERNHNSPSSPE
jgi:ABC-type Fe3+-siderophore transport system permease subunit